jgi:hypothetical protein
LRRAFAKRLDESNNADKVHHSAIEKAKAVFKRRVEEIGFKYQLTSEDMKKENQCLDAWV